MHADAGWTCKKNKDKVSNCTMTDNAYLMRGTVPQIGVKKEKKTKHLGGGMVGMRMWIWIKKERKKERKKYLPGCGWWTRACVQMRCVRMQISVNEEAKKEKNLLKWTQRAD